MAIINQVLVEVLTVVERQLHERELGGTQTTTILPNATSQPASSATSAAASSTMSGSSGGGGGPTSSPLLFFVALGFGVVFTNLWIIVGVKYCFRYNARNRAIRNGEDVDPINLENMPTRPHRRRREKKLMSMDEVNERFPLTKYKNWVASRAREGLPTSGGVTAPPSRAGSVRNVEGVIPSSPTGTKHSISSRPATAVSAEPTAITVSQAANAKDGEFSTEHKDFATTREQKIATPAVEENNKLEQVQTTASTFNKRESTHSQDDDDEDEDEQIHCAVPPEMLNSPGDSCAICIDTLEEDDDIRGLTCGHAFHAGCLDPWLTSRRACCPLCKADYYTPKPRPEGEAIERDATGRRRGDARMNLPQSPTSAWTGIRGAPRMVLPARFGGGAMYIGEGVPYQDQNRSARPARSRQAAAQPNNTGQESTGAAQNAEMAAPRRWMPRLSNPFSSMSIPAMRLPGRNRQAQSPAAPEASPSQLEAGIAR
jgi:hypothetical protein